VTPVEFRGDLWLQKTRVPGLSCGVVCVILRLAVLVELRLVTDRQTDRQTQSHGWYRGCIASRRKNWAGFRHTRILRFILHCLMRKFEYLRNKGTFSETLRQTSSIFVFRHDTPAVATSSHRASTSIYDTLCPWCKTLRKFDTRDYGQTRQSFHHILTTLSLYLVKVRYIWNDWRSINAKTKLFLDNFVSRAPILVIFSLFWSGMISTQAYHFFPPHIDCVINLPQKN